MQAEPGMDVNFRLCETALLSQEGSTIETAVEIVRGVVPVPQFSRLHSETFRLWNHPSRHRKERDDAALLTQEGNSLVLTAITHPIVLFADRLPQFRLGLRSRRVVHVDITIEVQVELFENRNQGLDVIVGLFPRIGQ